MSDLAIRAEELGKMYHIGSAQVKYPTLRESLVNAVKAPLQRIFNQEANLNGSDTIWALKGVSFEIKKGEVVGIIGRNGAGKSTLLKVLAHITEPTKGRVSLYGRVGSLLEVGTGFHPELTGRENIYLNGSILGMKRSEINRKFDEIVEFSEIEKFLDTPVKRYSSGMYVRLAFAVAAHLEFEILLVDEVLAVGDVGFQQKCLGKIGSISKTGRTVLFVSHNMAAIENLCSNGIILNKGEIVYKGDIETVINKYENSIYSIMNKNNDGLPSHILFIKPKTEKYRDFDITCLEILNHDNTPSVKISTWDRIKIRLHYHAKREVKSGSAVIKISSLGGVTLFLLSTQPGLNIPMKIKKGVNNIDCVLDKLPLSAGDYIIGCGLAIPNKEWLCWEDHLGIMSIQPKDVYQSGLAPMNNTSLLSIPYTWDQR